MPVEETVEEEESVEEPIGGPVEATAVTTENDEREEHK
jgi:hypothetical protein